MPVQDPVAQFNATEETATEETATEETVDADLPGHVEQTLADYLRIRISECHELDHGFGSAASELDRFVLGGGKRIRPTFAWWGWRAAGGGHGVDNKHGAAPATNVLRAASALELIQACALMHDDLIDDSATRRGHPTTHVAFANVHRSNLWAGSAGKFGRAAAVLLGDLALSWADDMLRAADLPPDALARALGPWQAMRTEVLAGQYLDVLGQARGDEAAEAALRIDELKSASYTIQRPLEFGAEIAGADQATLHALRQFGADIGVAFQLRDDLLGIFGDTELTGKPAGDDLREGKRTVLMAEAFAAARRNGDHAALDQLHAALGNAAMTEHGVEQIRHTLTRLGAVQAIEDRIESLTGTALSALTSVELPKPAASKLAELAVAATNRSA